MRLQKGIYTSAHLHFSPPHVDVFAKDFQTRTLVLNAEKVLVHADGVALDATGLIESESDASVELEDGGRTSQNFRQLGYVILVTAHLIYEIADLPDALILVLE